MESFSWVRSESSVIWVATPLYQGLNLNSEPISVPEKLVIICIALFGWTGRGRTVAAVWGWRDSSVVRNTGRSPAGPSSSPHGWSQPLVTPSPGNLAVSSGLWRQCCGDIHEGKTLILIESIFKIKKVLVTLKQRKINKVSQVRESKDRWQWNRVYDPRLGPVLNKCMTG